MRKQWELVQLDNKLESNKDLKQMESEHLHSVKRQIENTEAGVFQYVVYSFCVTQVVVSSGKSGVMVCC